MEPGSAKGRRSVGRRAADRLHGRPRLQAGLLLAAPLSWLGVVYIGSLVVLFIAAFWTLDTFTAEIVHDYGFQNFQTIFGNSTYRTIAARTIAIAALVTIADIVIAFPLAFYMAKIARRRTRNLLLVAVMVPLWSSYLVKVYAWRTILST